MAKVKVDKINDEEIIIHARMTRKAGLQLAGCLGSSSGGDGDWAYLLFINLVNTLGWKYDDFLDWTENGKRSRGVAFK